MTGPMVMSLGHAGLRVTGSRSTVVADPWMSPGGAFFGSWFPFPENSHLRTTALDGVTAAVVSHEHLDHLDAGMIRRLPVDVPLLVPQYPAPTLRRRIAAMGLRRPVELPAWERYPIDGGWLTAVPEACPMCHDAAVVIHLDGRTILHVNDARTSVAQVRRIVAETDGVDLMLVQTSGASWHPVCYEYPPDLMAAVSAQKRHDKLAAVARLVRAVRPRVLVPYAGPPAFLDPELAWLNQHREPPGVFPDHAQTAQWLAAHLHDQQVEILMPGDAVDLSGPRDRQPGVLRDPRWSGFTYADTPNYLADYAARRAGEVAAVHQAHPAPGPGLGERLAAHLEQLGALSDWFLARIGLVLRLDILGPGGGTWDAWIGSGGVRVDDAGPREADYRLRLEGRWLEPVLAGTMRWEDLLLSMRLSASRDPDVYNDYLVGLLKHADRMALQAVQTYEETRATGDRVEVGDGSQRRAVNRFCPHAGEDLSEVGVVEDGTIRCLGHNFVFDLETGECLNARCEPLGVAPAAVRGQ